MRFVILILYWIILVCTPVRRVRRGGQIVILNHFPPSYEADLNTLFPRAVYPTRSSLYARDKDQSRDKFAPLDIWMV